jgi:hypothetical protein
MAHVIMEAEKFHNSLSKLETLGPWLTLLA